MKINLKCSISLILALLLSVGLLAGCGGQSSGGGSSQEASPPAQSEAPSPAEEPASQEDDSNPNEMPPDLLPGDRAQVRVGALKGPTGMGLAELMDKNEKNAALNEYTFTLESAPDVIQGPLVNGDLDIAVLPTNLAAVLYNRTQGEIQFLALSEMRVLYIMAAPGVEVSSVADLAGKTLFTAGQGSTQEYVLDYLLRQSGLDPEADLTIEYKSEHAETMAQLLAGSCDVALLPQPFATNVTVQNPEVQRVLDVSGEWEALTGSALTMSCVVVRRAFAEENPAAVASFVEEYRQSAQWVAANADEAAALIGRYEIVPEAVAKLAIPGSAINVSAGADSQGQTMDYLKVLFDQNPASVGGAMPDATGFFCQLPQ